MKTIKVLNRKKIIPPPIWIMRQAGRYLPEFRETKKIAGGFINMIYSPKLAAKITLQPIKRFGFDSAIIFSDILVIPDSLGQRLEYVEGKGPILSPMTLKEMTENLKVEKDKGKLKRVYEAIRETKRKMDKKTSLLGFVGAPLTIFLFMIDSNRSKNYKKLFNISKKKKEIKKTFKLLEDAIAAHAIKQITAGADAIQIFDTWASVAENKDLVTYSINPIKKICKKIKRKFPKIPIIVFPKNVRKKYLDYIIPEIDCISVGNDLSSKDIKEIQKKKVLQGNLSPEVLFKGGKKMEKEVLKVLKNFSEGPFIFNLSHGILPETPVENVEKLIRLVKDYNNYK